MREGQLNAPAWATHKANCEGKSGPSSAVTGEKGKEPDCCEAKGLAAAIVDNTEPPEHGCGRKKAPARCPGHQRTTVHLTFLEHCANGAKQVHSTVE